MNVLVPKVYPLLAEAVEAGVETGYRKAFKHNENPSEDWVIQQIVDSTLTEIFERFDIPEDFH